MLLVTYLRVITHIPQICLLPADQRSAIIACAPGEVSTRIAAWRRVLTPIPAPAGNGPVPSWGCRRSNPFSVAGMGINVIPQLMAAPNNKAETLWINSHRISACLSILDLLNLLAVDYSLPIHDMPWNNYKESVATWIQTGQDSSSSWSKVWWRHPHRLICHAVQELMIMQRKYREEMKEAEKLSSGEKGSLPPLLIRLVLKSSS